MESTTPPNWDYCFGKKLKRGKEKGKNYIYLYLHGSGAMANIPSKTYRKEIELNQVNLEQQLSVNGKCKKQQQITSKFPTIYNSSKNNLG